MKKAPQEDHYIYQESPQPQAGFFHICKKEQVFHPDS